MHNELTNNPEVGIKIDMFSKERNFLLHKLLSKKPESEPSTFEKILKPDFPTAKKQKPVVEEKISTNSSKFTIQGLRSIVLERKVPPKSWPQPEVGAKPPFFTNIVPEVQTSGQPAQIGSAPEEPSSSGTQKVLRVADINFRTLAEQYAQEAPDKVPGAFLRAVQCSLERYKARWPRNIPPPTPEELGALFKGDSH